MKQKRAFIEQNHRKNSFYKKIMNLFGLESIIQNNLLYILNKNLKNGYQYTFDNKQMIRMDVSHYMPTGYDEEPVVLFNPLSNLEKSCSHLLIDDSIHLYLRNLTFNIFEKIITTQDGTIAKNLHNMFDTDQLNDLLKPNKNTKYKFYNLFNIVSATSFSKNLISFEIDFTNSPQNAKVNFKYPLYDMLSITQHNTIFGIHLEDNEIRLFKQIYENYIIPIIDNLFQEPINIPDQSNYYPKFYILATIKLMLEETYWKKYNICFIWGLKGKIERYKDMLSSLNYHSQYDVFTKFDNIYMERTQKLDQEAYKNEIKTRQESEPDWLLLRENMMKKDMKHKQEVANNSTENAMENFRQYTQDIHVKYMKKFNTFLNQVALDDAKNNYQIWKKTQEWDEIFYWQDIVLDLIRNNGGGLWFNFRIDKYCFYSKDGGKPIDADKNEIGKLLTRALQDKITNYLDYNSYFLSNYAIEIVLVHKLKGIGQQRLNINEKADNIMKILLFENAIDTIDDDVFDINNNYIYFKQNDNDFFFTRNRFIPNEYLLKKYHQNKFTIPNNTDQTFIEKVIYHLVKENKKLSDYIMNWLAYYFQNLQKSKTALVLLGDKEVTEDIFWNIIIKEIFSQQYCTTINDKEHETALVSSIAKDKLFFHIGDIIDADTKFDDNTLASIIKDLLIKPSVITETNEEIDIHGQMIITAKNPAPYLKKVLSKCTVIEVNNIDTIIENLNCEDEAELEDMIRNDLHNFTDKLLQYRVVIEEALNKIDTEARQTLKSSKFSNINKEDIDKQIDTFIDAIKTKNIDYFDKVKDIDNGAKYEQMKNAFEKDDGYFINQYLFEFYNLIHEQKFQKKQEFRGKLKEKDDMFNQEVKILRILDKDKNEKVLFQAYKTSKETGNKELYKIKNYKLASNISIPKGATIISSQDNIKKFTFEDDSDIDPCIKRTEEYRRKKET